MGSCKPIIEHDSRKNHEQTSSPHITDLCLGFTGTSIAVIPEKLGGIYPNQKIALDQLVDNLEVSITLDFHESSMKIYFAGSIRGVQPNKDRFKVFITHLCQYGEVLTEHSFDYSYKDEIKFNDQWIYETDMKYLREANALVAEVSAASLGVGYEIAKAEDLGIPILCLYRIQEGRKLSAMLNGNKGLIIGQYHETAEALEYIDKFIKRVREGVPTS